MHYLTLYYKNLCEQLDAKLQAQLAELDRRKKEREENKKLKSQLDAAFAEKTRKETAMYNIPNMPNLSANIEFASQSRARSGSGTPTPTSQLDAFSALSPEKQKAIAPGLPTPTLKGMQQAQYERSKELLGGRSVSPTMPSLTPERVGGLNVISKTLEDRKGAMGGKAGAASYASAWSQEPTSERTKKSMAVRTPKERLAMLDALHAEGLKILRQKGKSSPEWKAHIKAVNEFSKYSK